MKELYELKGEGNSIRGIARELGISRNTVRRYVRSPEVPKAKLRPKRGSKLDPYKEYIDTRLSEGLDNCVVLLREIREIGIRWRLHHAEGLCEASAGGRDSRRRQCGSRPSRVSRLRWTGESSATPRSTDAGDGCGRS